jgi:transposase
MTNATVLSGPERRRRWSTAEKQRLVADSVSSGLSVAEFARRHDVHPNLLHAWRRQAKVGALSALPDAGARLVAVTIAAERPAAHPARDDGGGAAIEVVLRNGRLLRVPERASSRRVAQLADALEGALR